MKTSMASQEQGSREANPYFDQEVAQKAYFMYLNEGSDDGFDEYHWLRAESEVEALQVARIASVASSVQQLITMDGSQYVPHGKRPPMVNIH